MKNLPRPTVWRVIFLILAVGAAYATWIRFAYGLGASTNLSNQFPWGIWIGFDILCGVGLAAGGFTLAAIVHIFNVEKYKPIVRPAILTAFLGYSLVVVALLFDLGRPYRIWHALVMWNPRSVMFEVAWCVMLYSTVLFLEFLPVVLEKFGLHKPLKMMKTVMYPLVIAGVILSTLHQSSLGSLFLIVPEKLHPLWYSPLLPVLFFISAVAVGLAMTIFESWHSARAFGKQLELPLLNSIGRILAVTIALYLTVRFLDLHHRGALVELQKNTTEAWLFGLEIALMLLSMLMLFRGRIRHRPGALYAAAVLYIFGFVAHRLNISTTGIEASAGVHYFPRWTELVVTLFIIAVGFALFRLAAQYLPVFEHDEVPSEVSAEVPHRLVAQTPVPSMAKGD